MAPENVCRTSCCMTLVRSATLSSSNRSSALLSALLSPDRWLLWLGLLFVLSVYYFPTGVVGRLRSRAALKMATPKPGPEEAA